MSLKVQKGFSLLEVAIGLLILGFVMLALQGVFKSLIDTNNIVKEKSNIESIEKSLQMYLQVNLRLPCPDGSVNGDGVGDYSSGVCAVTEGYLPYSDIGTISRDAWGNPYYYIVNTNAVSDKARDICESASVFGKDGTRGATHFFRCVGDADDTDGFEGSNQYYCATTALVPNNSDMCTYADDTVEAVIANSTNDPRIIFNNRKPNSSDVKSPYFHLSTPPIGDLYGDGDLILFDEDGVRMDSGISALVLSWGSNGISKYRYGLGNQLCDDDTTTTEDDNEFENCNGDSTFIYTTVHEGRDFMAWITVHDAKLALITQPAQ